ncbi:hypothetical protein OA503_06575 [Prochlorococcus sp. AH-716-K03]|nr:hypothetical protein [Prochlorococcus sp. AH-716-K03]
MRWNELKTYGEGEITSHSTTAVGEPYSKHFREELIYPKLQFMAYDGTLWTI